MVSEDERHLVYENVDKALDIVEQEICTALSENFSERNMLYILAGRSIEELVKLGGDD